MKSKATTRGKSAPYSIGEVADRFGISLRTLRFYEDKGLVVPDKRGTSRFYSDRDVSRIESVLSAKRLGFTLQEINQIISNDHNSTDILKTLSYDQIEGQIKHLEAQKRQIDDALGELVSAKAACARGSSG